MPDRAGAAVTERPDPAELRAAVADADLRVLVMCLVHLTGEMRWLEPPYRPMRDVRLVADPQAGYAPEIQNEIRETVIGLLENGAAAPVIGRMAMPLRRSAAFVTIAPASHQRDLDQWPNGSSPRRRR